MHRVSFSVIVTTYNFADFVEDAVRSALAQTADDTEVIVVDDGSTDGTGDVLAGIEGIQIIRQDNLGVANARRNGFRASRGDYVVFLDGDDALEPTYLAETWSWLCGHPKATFCYTWMKYFGARDGVYELRGFDKESLILDGNHIGIGALQPRGLFEAIGGFDELQTHEDWDYWLKAVEAGHAGILLPKPLYLYRQHAEGVSRNAAWDPSIRTLMWQRHRRLYKVHQAKRFLRRRQFRELLRTIVE